MTENLEILDLSVERVKRQRPFDNSVPLPMAWREHWVEILEDVKGVLTRAVQQGYSYDDFIENVPDYVETKLSDVVTYYFVNRSPEEVFEQATQLIAETGDYWVDRAYHIDDADEDMSFYAIEAYIDTLTWTAFEKTVEVLRDVLW